MNELKYYVYIYLDPRKPGIFTYGEFTFNFEPFYVGKGNGNRYLSHLQESTIKKSNDSPKVAKILKLKSLNLKPVILKVKYFTDEMKAYHEEVELIKEIGSNFIPEIKDGPLTNMILYGTTPPNLKGKTYLEIYGSPERAEEERLKRREKLDKYNFFDKTGMKHTPETIEKISKASKEGQKNGGYRTGIPHDEETKLRMSTVRKVIYTDGKRINYELIDPNGNIYNVVRLQIFCNLFNLSKSTLEKTLRTKKSIKYGKTMGWYMKSSRKLTENEWELWKGSNLPY